MVYNHILRLDWLIFRRILDHLVVTPRNESMTEMIDTTLAGRSTEESSANSTPPTIDNEQSTSYSLEFNRVDLQKLETEISKYNSMSTSASSTQ